MKTLLLLFTFTLQTFAFDIIKPAYGLWGIGVGILDNNYKDEDLQTSVAPYIFGGYGDLNFEANRATYTLWGNGTMYTSLVGQLRTHQKSDKYDKKVAFELGADIGVILPYGFVTRLALLGDVSGVHKGYELDYQLFRHDTIGPIALLSSVGMQYQSDALSNYYYGFNSYKPDASYSGELEFIATLPIDDFGLFAGVRSYWFSSQVTDSPIVASSNTTLYFFGVGYEF
ncbi:MAG TPA: hypothetical protein ENK65_00595 [Helicobacteraceae bacterium]|nr:hypothetical protein [Helicobacteraceae bacterium]